jgi:hypothetical protein
VVIVAFIPTPVTPTSAALDYLHALVSRAFRVNTSLAMESAHDADYTIISEFDNRMKNINPLDILIKKNS